MSTLPTITVTPAQAAGAYRRVEQGPADAAAASAPDFGAALSQAMQGVVATGRDAEAQAMQAISGGGNLTSVVTALSRADLALQTTVAIRDRVVQAYQDIIKMPI